MTPTAHPTNDDGDSRRSIFDAVMGAVGCDECDADVTVIESTLGVHHVMIAHDDDCPTYLRMERSASTPWN